MPPLTPENIEEMPLPSSKPLEEPSITELMMSNWNPIGPPEYDHLGLLPYEYEPLPNKTSIRVIKLLEAKEGLPHCISRTVDIFDQSVPYHCLSYTWGNPHADGNFLQESFNERGKAHTTPIWPIVCDGKIMMVQKNLYDSLIQSPRKAWARRLDRPDKKGRTVVHKLAMSGGMKVPVDDVDLNMVFRALGVVRRSVSVVSIFHALLVAGADIHATDCEGKSALHHAAENGHTRAVTWLVSLGLDVTGRDQNGSTAFDYAEVNCHDNITEFLQRSGESHAHAQWAAVRLLQSLDKPDDWVWIDRVSINQADTEEVQSQIQIMDVIYSRATFIKVWLGEEDPLTGAAADLIRAIDDAQGCIRDSQVIPYRENPKQSYIDAGLPVIPYNQWLALGILYRRQWFRRVWIFQEIVSANDVAMWCGQQEIPFAAFVRVSRDVLLRQYDYGSACFTLLTPPREAAHHLELNLVMMYKYSSLRAQATILGSEEARKEFSTSHLIEATRALSSTVPKDKVFAILGLISLSTPGHRWTLDYSLSTKEVFSMFTRNIMAERESLNILRCGAGDSTNNIPGLPSWVPDFSVTACRSLSGAPENKACGDRHQKNTNLLRVSGGPLSQAPWYALQAMSITPDDERNSPRQAQIVQVIRDSLVPLGWNVLRVEGAMFDRVQHVGKRRTMDGESIVRLDTSWLDLAQQLAVTYPTGEGRSEAFWRTLCANQTPTGERPSTEYGDQFRTMLCKMVCGEAQSNAAATNGSSASDVTLEVLSAQGMRSSHQLQSTTDADECFQQVIDSLEQLDRLAGSESKSWFPSRNAMRQFQQSAKLRIFSDDGHLLGDAFAQPFEVSYRHAYGGRRLYVTERKYIGLGPENVSPGDEVWLLPGSDVPRVLKDLPIENDIKRFQMVGDTYLHGIMQGEAIKGLADCFQTIDLV